MKRRGAPTVAQTRRIVKGQVADLSELERLRSERAELATALAAWDRYTARHFEEPGTPPALLRAIARRIVIR